MTLGENIAALRNKQGLSQIQLAKKLNIGTSTLGMWETDKRKPNPEALAQIADYFNVTTDYLLGRNNTPQWADHRDTTDLKKFLDDDSGMTYDGDNLTEEENEQLRVALTQIFWKRRRAERKISRDTEENL